MASEDGLRRLRLSFEGEVQGVGFRWTARKVANEIGATGWVRNEWDGSVSMELQGTDNQIARFFGMMSHAWGRYQPSYVIADKEEIAVVADEYSFRVRF